MSTAPADAIREAIGFIENRPISNFELKKLAGDASDRRYFRAKYNLGDKNKSLVVMDILDVENICKSEEVTLYHDASGELPFINIHRFLKKVDAPVPEILFFDRDKGLMLLEDLGDQQLLYEAEIGGSKGRAELYKQAIDILVKFEVQASKAMAGSDCIAFEQSFAPELLAWEFEHYLEYGIEALHKIKLQEKERAFLKKAFLKLSNKIAGMERTFTHRDYHSRNLLVRDQKISIIDFQDALYGPLPYDLASLLRDSYINLGDELRDELIGYYVDQYSAAANKILDYQGFRRDFDLVAMQRNLKAAGRFVFIDRVKGNSSYLEAIPRTLAYVKSDVKRNPEYESIFEILSKYEKRFDECQ